MVKFIHAADVHLGSSISNISVDDTKVNAKLMRASFDAFLNLVHFAKENEVDFILFPGDFFESTSQSPFILEFVNDQFNELKDSGIKIFLSFSNHDFSMTSNNQLDTPENVFVFDDEVSTQEFISKDGKSISVSGFSYSARSERSKLNDFPAKDSNSNFHIGMYHGEIGNETSNYSPFNLEDMINKNFDYWALGHIHLKKTLNEMPFIGYSGNLQGRNETEIGEKGFYFVQEEQGKLVPAFVRAGVVQWSELSFSLGNEKYNEQKTIDLLIENITKEVKNQFTIYRIELQDVNELSSALREKIASGELAKNINRELFKQSQDEFVIGRLTISENSQVTNFAQIDDDYWKIGEKNIFTKQTISELLSKSGLPFVDDYFNDEKVIERIKYRAKLLVEEKTN